MRPDQERWAEALKIEKMHGDNTWQWISGRIADLVYEEDEPGVARFMAIRANLRELGHGPRGEI